MKQVILVIYEIRTAMISEVVFCNVVTYLAVEVSGFDSCCPSVGYERVP